MRYGDKGNKSITKGVIQSRWRRKKEKVLDMFTPSMREREKILSPKE